MSGRVEESLVPTASQPLKVATARPTVIAKVYLIFIFDIRFVSGLALTESPSNDGIRGVRPILRDVENEINKAETRVVVSHHINGNGTHKSTGQTPIEWRMSNDRQIIGWSRTTCDEV